MKGHTPPPWSVDVLPVTVPPYILTGLEIRPIPKGIGEYFGQHFVSAHKTRSEKNKQNENERNFRINL